MAVTDLLSDLLGRIGVERIVWIDDRFATVEEEACRHHLVAIISAIRNNDEAKLELPKIISTFDPGAPAQIQDKMIEAFLDANAGKLKHIEDQLKEITQRIEDLPVERDITISAFDEIVASLKVDVQKYGHREWGAFPKTEKSKLNKCLFLVDRQFTREGAPENFGDQLVYEIGTLGCEDYFCIMFTYTADIAMEDETRTAVVEALRDLAGRNPLSPNLTSFHVLAKARLSYQLDAVAQSFATALRYAFLRSLYSRLIVYTQAAMDNGVLETVHGLSSLSIYDVDRSVFQNSFNEGASEIDVIYRMLALGQRRRVEDLLVQREAQVLSTLDRLRLLQEEEPVNSKPSLGKDSPLKEWRHEEIFVQGRTINSVSAPLACGDIFAKLKKDGRISKRYALLSQPCDLAVRGDGYSKGEEGFFVEVTEADPEKVLAGEYKRPYFYSVEFPEGSLVFDFREWGSVSLEVLRLAVFNQEGRVAFMHGAEMPRTVHLPGWKKIFDKVKNRFNAKGGGSVPAQYRALSLNSRISNREGKGDQSYVEFPYMRERRVRTPYAEAVLSAFLNYNSRAAFDHDFAATRDVGNSTAPIGQQITSEVAQVPEVTLLREST